jgi:hypothetical protein
MCHYGIRRHNSRVIKLVCLIFEIVFNGVAQGHSSMRLPRLCSYCTDIVALAVMSKAWHVESGVAAETLLLVEFYNTRNRAPLMKSRDDGGQGEVSELRLYNWLRYIRTQVCRHRFRFRLFALCRHTLPIGYCIYFMSSAWRLVGLWGSQPPGDILALPRSRVATPTTERPEAA